MRMNKNIVSYKQLSQHDFYMGPPSLARAKGRDRGIFEVTNSWMEGTGGIYAPPRRPNDPNQLPD